VRPTLHTERLALRPLTDADLPDLVALNGDPEVMRYIGPPMPADEVAAELPGWVAGDGRFGLWAGVVDDAFVGIWFLTADPDDPRAGETGWRLPRSAWGHGYATEGGQALLTYAFETLGLDRVWAETMAVNTRSRRVMERLGMRHLRTDVRDWDEPIPGWEQGEMVHELTRTDVARALWDDEAQSFDEAADHGLHDPSVRAAWRALMLDLLPPAPARVADLGCGTGSLAHLLTEEGYDVTGVDLSPEMVRRARAKVPGVTFVEADASAPPLDPASYDVVLSRHVLWALPDPLAALERWVGLLRDGGRLVLVEGSWSTGAGLTGAETVALVESVGRTATLRPLPDAAYWGREITDERYAVTA
jgi:RimJ/RimL family protein N-acetyltransferase/2-polyprenyl-3-methyl-5-hydroxy-6-metoxy-1,4-benzoquinol methylase